ncbi:RHS domain-containing protein [Vibrio sp. B511a]|uniref:RHS repeat-associated core domain-containing protein n=1 Tax=Vibrio TaxID=662 RepID=UPI001BD6D05D|nr:MULTISPECIES: RHS repeat-associated core domain-containing protein [Vibrio]EGQ8015538.1 RHS repeat protein [Vibrio alginolyticus]MBS9971765.1 RHS repeat protein [Vibrio alginolyticus]MDK9734094.1 RHS domain-containing protein [Vibrio sp. B511a]
MIPQFVIPITNRFGESYHFSGQLLTSGEPKTFVTKQEAIEFLESFGELDHRSVEDLFYAIGQFKPNIPDGELTSQHYNSTFANALVNGDLHVARIVPTGENYALSSAVTPPPTQNTVNAKPSKGKGKSNKKRGRSAASDKPQQQSSEKHEKAGDPVSLVTGEEILELYDIELQQGTTWQRTYRSSQSDVNHGMGFGWRHAFQFELREKTNEKDNVIAWEFVDYKADITEFEPVDIGATSYQIYAGASCYFLNSATRIVTLANGHQYRFEQKDDRWLVKQVRNGTFSTFQLQYSRNHRLIEIAYNKRSVLECQYDKQGRLVELLNAKSQKVLTTYTYDEHDDLVSATNHLGLKEQYQYSGHLIVKRIRPTGFTHYFAWDGEGAKAKCIRNVGDAGIYDYRFHYQGNHSSYSDSLDHQWSFLHDEQGNLLEKISPTGKTWRWQYDELGRKAQAIYPDQSTVNYQYNQHGQLVSKFHSSGKEIQYGYDGLGKLVKTVSPDGDIEKAYYNSLGQRVWDTDQFGCVTEYDYDKHGQVVKKESEDGKKSQWWWDEQQRLIANEIDGTLLRYSYNEEDLVNGVAYPDGCIAQLAYDQFGRRTSVSYFNDEDKVGYSEEYSYDEHSRVAQIRTPAGITSYQWGALAQQEAVIFPDGSHISYEYDQQRNLTKLVRSDGLEFEFLYDDEGQLSGTVGFDNLQSQFDYDHMGRIHRKQVADRTVLYRYDAAGYLKHVKAGNGSSIVENHFNYTLGGRLTFASNRHHTLQYQYSSFGHLTKRIQGQFEIAQEFNRVGQRVSQVLPDNTELNFSYDRYGRFSAIRFGNLDLPQIKFHYDEMGRVSQIETAHFNERIIYDGVGRLVEQHWPDREKKYVYNAQNRISSIINNMAGATHYQYDTLGQLKRVNASGEVTKFEYDSFGNPTLPSSEVFADRIEVHDDVRFKYDAQGNQTKREGQGHVQTRVFDALNQLIEVHTDDGISQYEYDALGRRTKKITQQGVTEFLWEGERLIGERSSGAFRWYLYQPETYTPVALLENDVIYWYQCDQVGKPERLIDCEGNVVWSASYDAHGFAHVHIEKVVNPLRFQGQYFDQETNLHYNLARYYDPKLGRFIQQDPISIAGGINHYQYAVNPIQWIDPTGFLCEEGLKRLGQMLAEYQAQSDVPQEVCDQILEAAKESSVGEGGVRSQVKIRKPKGKNHIRYEYDLDHIDCEKNEITFYRHINHSDGSKHEVQYVVGIEEFVNAHVFDSEKVGGDKTCTIFTEDLVLNKADYKDNSEFEFNNKDEDEKYKLSEECKQKVDECLAERQKAMDARSGEEGHNAQIAKINQQSAKIGELVADDFVRNIRPNAKLIHPKDLATSGSKPGDFDMVYLSDDPEEIIIVEAKGGSSPLGSRKIGNMAYQQGTTEYTAAIIGEMSKQEQGTTEKIAANHIKSAIKDDIPIRYIHTQAEISSDGKVSKIKAKEFDIDMGEFGNV